MVDGQVSPMIGVDADDIIVSGQKRACGAFLHKQEESFPVKLGVTEDVHWVRV